MQLLGQAWRIVRGGKGIQWEGSAYNIFWFLWVATTCVNVSPAHIAKVLCPYRSTGLQGLCYKPEHSRCSSEPRDKLIEHISECPCSFLA
jgi:hypothetical protein